MADYLSYYASKAVNYSNGESKVFKDKGHNIESGSGLAIFLTNDQANELNDLIQKGYQLEYGMALNPNVIEGDVE